MICTRLFRDFQTAKMQSTQNSDGRKEILRQELTLKSGLKMLRMCPLRVLASQRVEYTVRLITVTVASAILTPFCNAFV
jgi:hypothetical protein